MIFQLPANFSFSIANISSCDFNLMPSITNTEVIELSGKKASPKLITHLNDTFKISSRYRCHTKQNAIDLARSALSNLLQQNPSIKTEAEFLIFAGISNPLPATTISTLLAGEFGINNVTCLDIKSGCASALIAFNQALAQLSLGAKAGIIIAAENLSKFIDPSQLQMALSIGDGAAAMYLTQKPEWRVLSAQQGTDPAGSEFMRVPARFPINYDNDAHYYQFKEKPAAIKLLQQHWINSLRTTLEHSHLTGAAVQHYIAHQIDVQKNKNIAAFFGIAPEHTAINFDNYGNMGCPTVMINLEQWLKKTKVASGDTMILQAVGGGISWACIGLEKL